MTKNPFTVEKDPHGDLVVKINAEGIKPNQWEGYLMEDGEPDDCVQFDLNLFPDDSIEYITSVENLHEAIGEEIQSLQEIERLLTLLRDMPDTRVEGDWYRREGDLNMRIYILLTNPLIKEAFETYNNSSQVS